MKDQNRKTITLTIT